MQISVPLTPNGYLPDQYGKYAPDTDRRNGNPTTSFPITISAVPAGTQSLALTLLDYDAVPVSGFPWIHWIAANFPGETRQLPANVSLTGAVPHRTGHNSTAGSLIGNADPATNQHYAGPNPPDKDHDYQLTVYALDTMLPLDDGFWLNDLLRASAGHILATATLTLPSRV